MGFWTKPPVKAAPKQEAPAPAPAPAAPPRKQEAPPAPKPPPVKAPAPTRAAPYQKPPSTPPAAKTTAPGVGTRETPAHDFELKGSSFPVAPPSDDFVLRGSSFTPVPRPPSTGFKAGTAPGTPERAAAIRAELERLPSDAASIGRSMRDLAVAEFEKTEGRLDAINPFAAEREKLAARDKEVAQKQTALGIAEQLLREKALVDSIDPASRVGLVTQPGALARLRRSLMSEYGDVLALNVPITMPDTSEATPHPYIAEFRAADEDRKQTMLTELAESTQQARAAFDAAEGEEKRAAGANYLFHALTLEALSGVRR